MTDEVQGGMEWVPRFGMLEVPAEREALIRGLFELAAFVADHPELPIPYVDASFYTGRAGWDAQRAVVDQAAAALGLSASDRPEVGFYEVDTHMGSVRVHCTAITADRMQAHEAHMSYSDNVQPEESLAGDRLGHSTACAAAKTYGGGAR